MGIFNEHSSSSDTAANTGERGTVGRPGIGFKLTDTGDYDMQNKKLVNVDEGENNQDVVNKHQLDVGLQTKPNKTDVLLLDGTTHMVGDLNLRGNKIILPGEIQMDRKLITNLDTDENQDLSAVNMITLKNKVEPKADKDYVDFEITKQNALINTFVKKTGDQMNGDINMNNNFIQNVATPTSSHQGVNKGYCDYNFLNRQKGGVIMGPLSMNRNDLIGIPDTPKFGYSAVNKNYVDGEFVKKTGDTMTGVLNMNGNKIKNVGTPYTYENDAAVNVGFFNTELNASNSNVFTQITNAYKQYVDGEIGKTASVDTTQFIKKDGSVPMAADLDMGTHKIINVGQPTIDTDAASKGYIDNTLAESHLISSYQSNEFKYLDDINDTSSEYNIIVEDFADFDQSPHKNKKAYKVILQRDVGSNNYRSRMGFNLYPLPLGTYTMIFEYHPPQNTNIQLSCQSTTAYVHRQDSSM